MDKMEWINICTKLKEPMKEITRILNRSNVEFLGLNIYGKAGFATALFRENEEEFSVTVDKNGKMELKNGEGKLYYSSI